jgi:hypothetical protein
MAKKTVIFTLILSQDKALPMQPMTKTKLVRGLHHHYYATHDQDQAGPWLASSLLFLSSMESIFYV